MSRLLDRLEALYRIGGAEGANRPGLSAAEEEAHALLSAWLVEAGAEVARDAVGNTFGRLPGEDPAAAEIWVGSHLDSVPSGGRFDGALGVVAAVAVLERLRDRPRRRTVTAVAFRDEEGWRFGRGFIGSRAVCGLLEESDLALRDRDGRTVVEALGSLGFEAPRPGVATAGLPAAFVELHVEQGPVLAEAGAQLGVPRSIVGMVGLRLRFTASGGHAGTVPLARRADALVAAARYVVALRDFAETVPGAVATVGECAVGGGAANVVPSRVDLTVDARAASAGLLGKLSDTAQALAREAAASESGAVKIERVWEQQPVELGGETASALERACARVGSAALALDSGAGHDAGVLAVAGVDAGLLLVRSDAGGASHSPDETTGAESVELAVDALVTAVAELAGGKERPHGG